MAELEQPRGWFAGLRRLLKDRAEFHPPPFDNVTAQTVSDAQAAISRALKHSLASKLRDSHKAYIIREIPLETDKGQIRRPVIYLRHYLTVIRRSHRVALTKLLFSDHAVASERVRWINKEIRPSRELRLCRVCKTRAETPEHILFERPLPDNTGANRHRTSLTNKLHMKRGPAADDEWARRLGRAALRSSFTVDELAELAYTVYNYVTKYIGEE